jgi:hypothetical protein
MKMKRTFLYAAFICCCTVNILLIYINLDEISLNDERLLNVARCPLCFGTSMCDSIHFAERHSSDHRIELIESSTLFQTYFAKWLFNLKNVYYAVDRRDNRKLVLKKLAHDAELEEFDEHEKLCLGVGEEESISRAIQMQSECVSGLIESNRHILNYRLNADSLNRLASAMGLEVCFSNRLVDLYYENGVDSSKTVYNSAKKPSYFHDNIYLLTMLKINMEPIVLQVRKQKIIK